MDEEGARPGKVSPCDTAACCWNCSPPGFSASICVNRRFPGIIMSRDPEVAGVYCQETVEPVRECLSVGGGKCRRAAGVDAAAAQSFHEVAHAQPLLDVARIKQVAARIEHAGALGDHLRGERHIGGDHQVAG